MSDELTFWEQVTKIKTALTVVASAVVGAMILGGFILDWVVTVKVNTALSAMDLGTDLKIVDMDKVAAANTRTGEENAEDIGQNRRNVEAAFRQLMGMPQSDAE